MNFDNGLSASAPTDAHHARATPICVRIPLAMAMLGIGKTKLYELVCAGELEAIRIGRRTLILQASIDGLVDRLREGSRARTSTDPIG